MPPVVRSARSRWQAVAFVSVLCAIAGCQSGSPSEAGRGERIKSDPNESFSSKVFGVAASPRVTDSRIVRKGGGRSQVGKPYKVRGKWYYPKEQAGYIKTGKASWYGSSFHGRLTANGEVYDMFGLSAAHPTFPLPSYARVTNVKTGTSLVVRVNDRGPYAEDRVMDLSSRAAELLGYKEDGIGDIKVEYVGRAPTEGDDTKMLLASYRPGRGTRSIDDGLASGVMIAMNDTPVRRLGVPVSATRTRSTPFGTMGAGERRDRPGRSVPVAGTRDDDQMSVGSIIAASAEGSLFERPRASLGGGKGRKTSMIVSSYAPQPAMKGAAAAIAVAAGSRSTPLQRIVLGVIEDPHLVNALRHLSKGRGKLIVDADAGSLSSYAFEARAGEDVDALLRAFWKAGAEQAFLLHD